MLKKTVITSAVVSALLLSSSGIAAAVAGDKSGAQTPAASRLVMSVVRFLRRNYWAIQQP
ncbi:hypothetical protein [Klebsiella pneumoniae]|uniref:hypothetical protein n=1 Tax=Klebsiella pneumoniae TaxID=573 RepID=UPI001D0ECEA8|nr:hypothetical protein [Klebsiella pneumoniae]